MVWSNFNTCKFTSFMYAGAQLRIQDESPMKPLKPSPISPDDAEQGHRYSFHSISVAIRLKLHKLNAINLWKKHV